MKKREIKERKEKEKYNPSRPKRPCIFFLYVLPKELIIYFTEACHWVSLLKVHARLTTVGSRANPLENSGASNSNLPVNPQYPRISDTRIRFWISILA
ncbi:hypothetical protein CEXT_24981 [Caerostris extrusa]|uniref:Uncharacterized protein n=1 Tax=Caerostris extrusa TaxID=172846 RepID=A0AAV4XRQ0_CAEEX|nr:hypothetical protein CEXT_24981 [Caerostris extrusa]